ncbi:hypothetical protein QI320_12180 [Staphylococcus saprophyticus]|uniref:hypothetical protein n=1 Tax=Staphylococcus saprophyticus TaxID=29385 RepID=UPI0006588B5E|nr:hypothetical protein [Staphylococcus saprophyticus]MCM3118950.1 hypothetical protein [Staphylococcus saprophyticus]MDW3950828.1 hypothetical protein [Staphylococcus saprophyticus]MDW4036056.1 hypothetical protein [Staphylococcus saprophyticus]CRV30433.1 Uncharacterised protein [Streptococcus equi subsp. equi]
METITLTKEDLVRIVEQEVSKRLDGVKPTKPISIFSDVSLQENEIAKVNEKFNFIKFINTPYRGRHFKPLALRKFSCGGGDYFNGKVHNTDVHDLIRKLTLSAFGVTLNSDLSEREYEQAAKMYRDIKGYYLHLYEKRISNLSIEDFE